MQNADERGDEQVPESGRASHLTNTSFSQGTKVSIVGALETLQKIQKEVRSCKE